MKPRFVTYLAAGMLSLGTIGASQQAFAVDRPSGGNTTEKIPQVQTGRPVPIPPYWKPDGPWATTPGESAHVATRPRLDSEFCVSHVSHVAAICLDLKHLLGLLRFSV